MGHKSFINSTGYEITGGKVLISNTSYDIKSGRTLSGDTCYDIKFGVEPLVVYDGGSTVLEGSIDFRATPFLIVSGGASTIPNSEATTTNTIISTITGGAIRCTYYSTGSTAANGVAVATYGQGKAAISGIALSQYSVLHAIGYCSGSNCSGSLGVTSALNNTAVNSSTTYYYTMPELYTNFSNTTATEIALDISDFTETGGYIVVSVGTALANNRIYISKIWLT